MILRTFLFNRVGSSLCPYEHRDLDNYKNQQVGTKHKRFFYNN